MIELICQVVGYLFLFLGFNCTLLFPFRFVFFPRFFSILFLCFLSFIEWDGMDGRVHSGGGLQVGMSSSEVMTTHSVVGAGNFWV